MHKINSCMGSFLEEIYRKYISMTLQINLNSNTLKYHGNECDHNTMRVTHKVLVEPALSSQKSSDNPLTSSAPDSDCR
jgi:hypothetical protein